MGQYHLIVNLDKKEFLHPHVLGTGLKLLEQAGTACGSLAGLCALLATSNARGGGDFPDDPLVGRWAGDRIAIVGDYAEPDDLQAEDVSQIYQNCSHYASEEDEQRTPQNGWKEISHEVAALLERAFDYKFMGRGWRHMHEQDDGPCSYCGWKMEPVKEMA